MCTYGRDFLLGVLLLEPCISLTYARKTNKYTNYSFSLLIMYGSSYMFRHYIAIFRERLVPCERCSIEEESIEYCGCCGVLCLVTWCAPCTTSLDTTHPSTIFYRLLN